MSRTFTNMAVHHSILVSSGVCKVSAGVPRMTLDTKDYLEHQMVNDQAIRELTVEKLIR